MRWSGGRSESLHWKKHALLFHRSGGHGSSSGGPNKDANFILSSAVNIKKKKRRYNICRRTVTLWHCELMCSCNSGPHRHDFKWPLSVWCWRMSVAFPTPSRKKGGFGTCHLHNAHKFPTMRFISVKRKQPFPAFFSKKIGINKNPRQNPLYYKLPSTCSFPIS